MLGKSDCTKEEIEELYWEEGLDIRGIAKRVGVSKSTIHNWMKKHSIPRKSSENPYISKDKLQEFYLEKELPAYEIAKKYNVSGQTVYRWLDKYQIPKRPANPHPTVRPDLQINENMAYVLGVLKGDGYVSKDKSQYKIGLNVTSKAFSESFKQAIKKIGLNPCTYKRVREHKDQYVVKSASMLFYEWYNDLDMNKLVEEFSKEEKISFIRGIYESDGSFIERERENRRKEYVINISNTNKHLIEICDSILSEMGYITNIRKQERRKENWNDIYYLNMYRREDIQNFFETVDPCIKKGVFPEMAS